MENDFVPGGHIPALNNVFHIRYRSVAVLPPPVLLVRISKLRTNEEMETLLYVGCLGNCVYLVTTNGEKLQRFFDERGLPDSHFSVKFFARPL